MLQHGVARVHAGGKIICIGAVHAIKEGQCPNLSNQDDTKWSITVRVCKEGVHAC